jgi:hypothetical protein
MTDNADRIAKAHQYVEYGWFGADHSVKALLADLAAALAARDAELERVKGALAELEALWKQIHGWEVEE